MTFTGTQSAINAALNGLCYTPAISENSQYIGADNVKITVNDMASPLTGGPQAPTSTVPITIAAPWQYNGLLATYYDNDDFTGTSYQRIDSSINFNYGTEGSPSLVTVSNSSFEATNLGTGSWGDYRTGGSDSGWNFTDFSWPANSPPSGSGIAADGSGYNRPNAPDGTQTAFIQGQATMWQDVTFATAGNYAISFDAAYRAYYNGTNPIEVQVDGVNVGLITPTSTNFQTYHTDLINFTAGKHRISFTGTSSAGDCTTFIDNVSIGFQGTTWSARWLGTLTPDQSGTYTFYTTADDGVRFWINDGVNNVLLIDHLDNTGTDSYSASINLIAGHQYTIEMDYRQTTGTGYAKLEWSMRNLTRQVISSKYLQTADQTPIVSVPALQYGIGNQPIVFSEDSQNAIFLTELHNDGSPLTVTLTASQGTLALNGRMG